MKSNLLIRASAGSGKTRKLSLRYLELILKGATISTVLASTFTRKATGEILNRILLTAAQACTDEALCRELSENIGREVTFDELKATMRRLVQSLNLIRACSLNSFFNRIALCFPYEMGLKPGWRILENIEDTNLRRLAIQKTLKQNEKNAPVLVQQLFKGETVSRIADEVYQRMQELLTLKMTANHAAWEAIQQLPTDGVLNEAQIVEVLNVLEEEANKLEMAQKSKGLVSALRKIANFLRVNNWLKIAQDTLIRNTFKAGSGPIKYSNSEIKSPELLAALRTLARQTYVALIQIMQKQVSSVYTLITGFAQNYMDAKLQINGFQFDDMTHLVADFIAQQNGNLQPLFWRMNAPIDHLLLDEFQDTSLDQWHIFQPFGERCTSGNGHSFFCVGDVKQAIYRWRNGRAEIFDAIENTFPSIEQENSNVSWRSAPEILRCVNRFFYDPIKNGDYSGNYVPEPIASENDSIPTRELLSTVALRAWDGWKYETHVPSPKSAKYPGYWELRAMPEKPKSEKGSKDSPDEVSDSGVNEAGNEFKPKSDDVQWRWVAKQIAENYKRWHGMYRIGVLFRKNKEIGRLARFLREEGVEVSEEGKNPLANSRGVCLVLSLLTLMDFPENTLSWYYVGNSALTTFYPQLRWQDGKNITPEEAERCRVELHACLATLRQEYQAFGVGSFVEKLVRKMQPFCTVEEKRRLAQLRHIAANYEQATKLKRIAHFVEYVNDFKMEDPSGATVTLMSIHGSKGLQFDVVYLPELDFLVAGVGPKFVAGYTDDDVLQDISIIVPFQGEDVRETFFAEDSSLRHAMDLDIRDRIRENFSLLYVAMTRAIYAMYLFIQPSKPSSGKKKEMKNFGKIIRTVLAGAEMAAPEELLAWDGDPEWYTKTPQARSAQQTQNAGISEPKFEDSSSETALETQTGTHLQTEASSVPIVFRKNLYSSRDLVRRAPSNIEDKRLVDLSKKLDFSQQNTVNGTILHGWYEKIAWVENSLPSDEELIAVARPFGLSKDRLERLLKSFHNSLKSPKVDRMLHWTTYIPMMSEKITQAGILKEHEIPRTIFRKRPDDPTEIRWEVYREKELAIRTDTELLLGTLDRLILLRNDVQVFWADCIDYKTTRKMNNPDVLEEKIRLHSLQMQDYRNMLSLHYRISPTQIATHLIFSMLGVVREVPIKPIEPEMKRA